MNYGKYSIMHEDVETFARILFDIRKYRHNIETYRKEIVEMAISKCSRKSEQIDYIIRKTTDEISTKLQKYNRKFLILSIMRVKELAYNYEKDLTRRHEIQGLTDFLLIIISNNYDEFSKEFVHIEFDEENVPQNISEIIELAYLVIYSAVNRDHLFDCIDNYTILDITKNTLYPVKWEEFFDNDYENMNGKKKPEEYVIKNTALHKYIDDRRISMNYIKNELNSMFKQEYGFNITSIESLQKYKNRKRDYPLIVIDNKRNDLRKYFNIDCGEKIFEVLNCNIKGKEAYEKNILNYMELKPVFIDEGEIICSISHLKESLTIILNLLYSGDTQFAKYYNFPKDEFQKIEGHINTYMESRALGILIEVLYEKNYIVPKISYNNEVIPVADVKKIEQFGLYNSNFDSDLFFADIKRKIIYNIDFKYSNSPTSLKLMWEKSKNKIPGYIENLRERQKVIEDNPQKVKEILKIDDLSGFSYKSGLCTVRPDYYCYVKNNEWKDVYYTNWFRFMENLNKGNELLS